GGGGASNVSSGGGASVTVTGGGGACWVTVRVSGACVCGGGACVTEVGAAVVVGGGAVIDAGVGVLSSRITNSTAAVSAASSASTPATRIRAGLRYHGSGAASSSYGSWSNCICGRASALYPPPSAGASYSYVSVGATSGTSSASDHARARKVLDSDAP